MILLLMSKNNNDQANFRCRICDSDNLRLYYTQGDKRQYKFYKCVDCAMVNYDLSGGLNQEKYSDNPLDPRDDTQKSNTNKNPTYTFIRKHLGSSGSLLDIGCNNGRLMYLAMSDGWDVMGLELHQSLADKTSEVLGVRVLTENFMDFKNTESLRFDVVVMTHVLEHIPDSLLALNSINSLLNPGGHALFEFPDIEGGSMKFKRFMDNAGLHRRNYPASYMPGHCNEFSRESFKYLLGKTGFELIRWENYSRKKSLTPLYNLFNIGNKARALIKKIS